MCAGAWARRRQPEERLRLGVGEVAAVGEHRPKCRHGIRDVRHGIDVVANAGDEVVEDCLDEVVLVGEVPVERRRADTGSTGDLVEAHLGSLCGERIPRRGDQPLPVALYVLARRPHVTLLEPVARLPSYRYLVKWWCYYRFRGE